MVSQRSERPRAIAASPNRPRNASIAACAAARLGVVGIGQIAQVRGRTGDQRAGADPDQAKRQSDRFLRQQRAGEVEQPVRQHRGAGQPRRARP